MLKELEFITLVFDPSTNKLSFVLARDPWDKGFRVSFNLQTV